MRKSHAIVFAMCIALPSLMTGQSRPQLMDSLMSRYWEAGKFMGTVLVAEDGNIVYEKGLGFANMEWQIRNEPETRFVIASITKTFTAVLTMRLVQDGVLRLDNTISDFLPYYRKDIGTKVTIHHLLSHSSGIPNFIGKPGFMMGASLKGIESQEKFILQWCSDSLEFPVGSRFSYNNSGFFILGAIIEKATNMSFEDALKKYVLEPAGMTNTGINRNNTILARRASGYQQTPDGGYDNAPFWDYSWAFTAGYMYSTVGDFVKYDQALYGEKILSEEMKKKMFAPLYPAFGFARYGYGWTIGKLPIGTKGDSLEFFGHEGGIFGFNTWFVRIPEKNQMVVLLNNTSNCPLREISSALLSILNGKEYSYPMASAAPSVYRMLRASGKKSAELLFLKAKREGAMDCGWRELNALGYTLLRQAKNTEATDIFEINAQAYPDRWEVFDSLGDGYLGSGAKEKAIASYEHALELNPKSESSRQQLLRLKK